MLKDKTPKQKFIYISALIFAIAAFVSIGIKVLSAVYEPKYNATIDQIQFSGKDATLQITDFTSNNGDGGTVEYQVSTGVVTNVVEGVGPGIFATPYNNDNNVTSGVFQVGLIADGTKTGMLQLTAPESADAFHVETLQSDNGKYIAASFFPEFITPDGIHSRATNWNLVQIYVYDVDNDSWSSSLLSDYYDQFATYYGDLLANTVVWQSNSELLIQLRIPNMVGISVGEVVIVGEYSFNTVTNKLTEEISFDQGYIDLQNFPDQASINEIAMTPADGGHTYTVTIFDNILNALGYIVTLPMRIGYGYFSSTTSVCEYKILDPGFQKDCWVDVLGAPGDGQSYIHISNPLIGVQRLAYVDSNNISHNLLSWFATKNQHYVRTYTWDNEDFVILQVDNKVGLLDLRTGQWAELATVLHNQNVLDFDTMVNQSYQINVY